MKCLIIEDEKVAAERLAKLIQACDNTIEILDVLQSVQKSVHWFSTSKIQPELVFMDIQLADGLSFEIFEQIEIDAPIIFTTAYDEYALKAFKVNSIDYLLKPIDKDELCAALKKFHSNKSPQLPEVGVLDKVLKNLTNNFKSKFVVKVGEHIKIIPINEIQCFLSLDKNTFLQNLKGRDYAINHSLDQLEELLDPAKFFRISRKYIVSLDAIKDIISFSSSRLLIKLITETDNNELIVSRERVVNFKSWLES